MDEVKELYLALDLAQEAQREAESKAVSAEAKIHRLLNKINTLEERILQLEKANVDMDSLIQDYRVNYRRKIDLPVDKG